MRLGSIHSSSRIFLRASALIQAFHLKGKINLQRLDPIEKQFSIRSTPRKITWKRQTGFYITKSGETSEQGPRVASVRSARHIHGLHELLNSTIVFIKC